MLEELELITIAEDDIFPNSLISTAMQDGGKRKRRNKASNIISLEYNRRK